MTYGRQKIALTAVKKFLDKLGKPVTETAISELIEQKRNNPKDTRLEQELKLWKAEATSSTILNYVATILGIFRHNFTPLEVHIHVTSNHRTIPISEPILRSIHSELTQDEKDALDLMTYGAERRNALSHIPLENVHLVENSDVAILDIPARLSKTATEHPSIIPKELAERLLDKATRLNYNCLMPNFNSVFRRITAKALQRHKVRLTSHYLRKRFETIAERIPADQMNPNHWVILMGSRPTVGHIPQIYSLLNDRELVEEYETQLMPKLALSGETTKPQASKPAQLQKENQELKEQLLKLTKLLTEKLTT